MTAPFTAPAPAPRPQPAAACQAPQRSPVSDTHVAVAWILAVLSAGYMLPWAVAATRRKSNTGPIAVLNLLTGWTVVGWVVALVMACAADRGPVVFVGQQVVASPLVYAADTGRGAPGWYPQDGRGLTYWDGQQWLPPKPGSEPA